MIKRKSKTVSKKGCSSKKKIPEEDIFPFIQDRAYRLWDEAGRPQGRDWEFWFQAEEEVKERLKKILGKGKL